MLLYTSGFFLFKFIYLNQRKITLQNLDETMTNTFTIYMEILNWIVDMVTLTLDDGYFLIFYKLFLSIFANIVNFLERISVIEGLL